MEADAKANADSEHIIMEISKDKDMEPNMMLVLDISSFDFSKVTVAYNVFNVIY